MECKFIRHGIALSYDQIVKPCCEWKLDNIWSQQNHVSQVDLKTWHRSPQVLHLAQELGKNNWPGSCNKCQQTESQGRFDSIRGNGNHSYSHYQPDDITLEIRPGSVCNFACQTCWPAASSRVAEFHSKAGLVDIKTVNSNKLDDFDFLLPIASRLRDVIVLGGEPFYDKSCLKFLSWATQHLDANLIMFTNGSRIDFDFLKSYPGILTLVFSLDAVGKPAEYIRYGTEWDQVLDNYLAVKKIPRVNVRVNITCSVYNYLYIDQLIEFLCQDWPQVVSFGSPNAGHLKESAVPIKHRADMIVSLERAISTIQQTDIESGQKSNAINALTAHVSNLKNQPWIEADYQHLCKFVKSMDLVKNINIADYCADLAHLL
jgi:sulfatase maturation enzyme AslB (radical SAM superfamily)